MSEPEQDTEILLAILSSLLEPPIPSQNVLLDALINSSGDVNAAAKNLRQSTSTFTRTSSPGSFASNSRKGGAQRPLEDWLSSSSSNSRSFKKRKLEDPSPKAVKTQELNHSLVSGSSSVSHSISSSNLVPSLHRLLPLTLSSPEMVKKHTPCTLHLGILPPELACRLFYTLVDASKDWIPSKWFVADRLVASPHKTSFFARANNGIDDNTEWQTLAPYWYNGQASAPPTLFPPEMEEACRIVEGIVNAELTKRQRHPLEWGGEAQEGHSWKANVAVSNCYTGSKEGVGFHSDQLTYLGPMPTIASISLGTSRIFRLREVIPQSEIGKRQAQTFNIPVVHNSPDFRPETTPLCKCDVPCVLRADLKGRTEGQEQRYFWMCYAGAKNDGKGCSTVKVLDCKGEKRGPFLGDSEVVNMDNNTNK
ncbi:hypothetical protein Clacol_006321 [Clathrus columnatus]|uniref:Alpha-ketoglutarate-dependent dioxygenase AlkB-like domain-containing protein n=1 Tax=Clathrus columnatus TaxID=1419009 RepID=A0AAV5AGR0_9AGAM|nr:hypothetical protein Clacol_006321 [Clathrus columnatus]